MWHAAWALTIREAFMQQKTVTRPPSVRLAFRTFRRAFRHGYDNLFTLGSASLLWLVFALPLLPVVNFVLRSPGIDTLVLLVAAWALVPISAATAGLHRVTQPMTEERATSINRFWSNFRGDWGWSTRLGLVLLLGFIVWEGNRRFYTQSTSGALLLFSGFFLTLELVWLGISTYAWPLVLRQTDLRLRTTLRNAVVLVLANLPGVIVSYVLLFISCLILLIPPLFVLIPGFIALWSEEYMRLLLVGSGLIPPDEIADQVRE